MNARQLLALSFLFATTAHAQDSQVKKASASWDAYKAGDSSALDDARIAIDKAIVHKNTLDKGSVWVLFGKIQTEQTLANGMPSEDALNAAVEAWSGAVERGAGKDAVSEDLLRLIASATQAMTDDLEAKQNDEAWSRTTAALACRDLLRKTGGSEPRTEAGLLQLATVVAIRSGHVDEAVSYFATWQSLGDTESSVAVQVLKALHDAKGLDSAVAFAAPLLKTNAADPALLPALVSLMVAGDQAESAQKRVNVAAKVAPEGTGTDLMLAKLYLEVGNPHKSAKFFTQGLGRNPNLAEAWMPMALLHTHFADADLDALDAEPGPDRAARKVLEASRMQHLTDAAALMEQTRDTRSVDIGILKALLDIYEILGDDKGKQEVAEALAKATQGDAIRRMNR